ncbi:MAG: succinylglutamate desuccinylase/aspartoacylase family protein [Deltaproteobacteria bacterium]|nr:succinylglutamate desuccinylase/aspartoacylase family protein [Deltaproteobacteria bacterium]
MIRIEERVGGVEGTVRYQATGPDGAPLPGPRVAVIGWMHGNELVGGHTLDRLADRVEGRLLRGELLAVRANLAGHAAGRRHTPDGVDMNRLWDRTTLTRLRAMPEAERCYEQGRVLEIAPLLADRDAILDLHSTTRPSPAFLIYRDDQRHAQLAAQLGVRHLVTGLYSRAILDGGMSPDVGLCPGEASERVGFTFEAGQHDDPTNVERAWALLVRLLRTLGMWGEDEALLPAQSPVVFEVVERFRQSPEGTIPWRFVGHEGGEAAEGRDGPLRTLASFEEVQAGEVLLRRGEGEVVRAQAPFTLLLPTPQASPWEDLYYVMHRRRGGVTAGEAPRTHEQARAEALAVERMIDVLDDDGFALGRTWVSFDPRHVLDVCGALVARAVRQPHDSPHRRLTVVGRGDHGGDEVERRNGRRYRAAMRQAILQGVPLERVQLLRGSALGFVDALTGPEMRQMMRERRAWRAARGLEGQGMRLLLSARRPHTLSMLVIGDLDRALSTGDFRKVRAAILVEATTPVPHGDRAELRVVRAGLISARPEVLRAVGRFLGSVRDEHQRIMLEPPFTALPDGVRADDAALTTSCDGEDMTALREALQGALTGSWAGRLDGLGPLSGSRGEWLALAMARTGIFDPAAVDALLAGSEGGLKREAVVARLAQPASLLPRAEPTRRVPPPPIQASEVSADSLQRWLSWKRFLHTGQVIPHTRGKDVDLALTASGIQRRLARWFAEARARAASRPGEVLLVIAGDGLHPHRDPLGGELLWERHRAVLLDARVRYLRIQHVGGAHLDFLRALRRGAAERGPGAPMSVHWEGEHGASVNVVLMATREGGACEGRSLEGWRVDHCGIVLSDLEAGAERGYGVALFTEPREGAPVNQELIAFGRAHCEALLQQGGDRLSGQGGEALARAVDRAIVGHLTGWIAQARAAAPSVDPRWASEHLGLADPLLVGLVVAAALGGGDPGEEAARIWRGAEPPR